jgi:uncharacterized protein with GYD domain
VRPQALVAITGLRILGWHLHGRLESFHFAFGDTDVFAIAEVPDDEAAAAVAIAINSSGAVSTRTTKLLTVDQVVTTSQSATSISTATWVRF